MRLLIHLIPNLRCIGCARAGYVEEKTLLCLICFDFKVRTEERKAKLTGTMNARFASVYAAIGVKLREFQR
jgi:hypothetical protein